MGHWYKHQRWFQDKLWSPTILGCCTFFGCQQHNQGQLGRTRPFPVRTNLDSNTPVGGEGSWWAKSFCCFQCTHRWTANLLQTVSSRERSTILQLWAWQMLAKASRSKDNIRPKIPERWKRWKKYSQKTFPDPDFPLLRLFLSCQSSIIFVHVPETVFRIRVRKQQIKLILIKKESGRFPSGHTSLKLRWWRNSYLGQQRQLGATFACKHGRQAWLLRGW